MPNFGGDDGVTSPAGEGAAPTSARCRPCRSGGCVDQGHAEISARRIVCTASQRRVGHSSATCPCIPARRATSAAAPPSSRVCIMRVRLQPRRALG